MRLCYSEVMDIITLFHKALDGFKNNVSKVTPEFGHAPTPCSEWDVHALVNHVVNEVSWIPDLIEGKTISEVGSKYDGDLLGDNPLEAWQQAADAALKSVIPEILDKTVHLSFGDFKAREYLAQVTADLAIHNWDLAIAIHTDTVIDPELLTVVKETFLPMAEGARESGVFGQEVEVPGDASEQTKILAATGRKS